MENIEIWKDINGYEGLYQISNLGRVKSLERIRGYGNGYSVDEFIMSNYISDRGYVVIGLRNKNSKKTLKSLHRLLAEHFIPNLENKPTIDHIDRNKLNNSLCNLRWATYTEQNRNKPSVKLIENIKKEDIFKYYITDNNTLEDTINHFKVSRSSIYNILKKYDIKKNNSRFDN
jgi:hypothetical protein